VAVCTVRVYNTRGRGDLLPNNIILRISSSRDGRQSGATSTADGADGHAASGPSSKHVRFPIAKRTRTAVAPRTAENRIVHAARRASGRRGSWTDRSGDRKGYAPQRNSASEQRRGRSIRPRARRWYDRALN